MKKPRKWMKEKALNWNDVDRMNEERMVWLGYIKRLEPEFTVRALNKTSHLRVSDRVDLYPFGQRWHDIVTGERGDFTDPEKLAAFIRARVYETSPEII